MKKFDIRNRKQCEHPDCPWCARLFFRWYKTRMAQMSVKLDGAETSFSEAAAASIVPDKEE